jgi:cobalt-zinc-cadmium efflux system outer membrane protein
VDQATGYNWSAALSQELEIAGQQGARRKAVDAELEAQRNRVTISEREVAVIAWAAYFEAIAAREESALTSQLSAVAVQVATAARSRAALGLIAPVDADLAEATATRLNVVAIGNERRMAAANADLVWLVGGEPGRDRVAAEGPLDPLPAAGRQSPWPAMAERPEFKAADAERRALTMKAEALRRSRVPSPTLSIFAQNDPFEGHVLGLGLALPIPIPGWGRTYGGEIAETDAWTRRAETETENTKRTLQLAIVKARQTFESRQRELSAYSSQQEQRAQESLRSLGEEVAAGRLAVRDAVVAQQTLIDLLQGRLEARRSLCLASVELLRVEGFPLERGLP